MGFVADDQIEFRQAGLLRLGNGVDGLVGGKDDRHLAGGVFSFFAAACRASYCATSCLRVGRRGKGEIVDGDFGGVVVILLARDLPMFTSEQTARLWNGIGCFGGPFAQTLRH